MQSRAAASGKNDSLTRHALSTPSRKGDTDSSARIPVIERHFVKEQEVSARLPGELREPRGDVRIVAENYCTRAEFRRDRLILAGLVVGRMIAVVDKQIDGLYEGMQALDRIAVEYSPDAVIWR